MILLERHYRQKCISISTVTEDKAVFIDGLYRSRAGSLIPDLPRLERVEVLNCRL